MKIAYINKNQWLSNMPATVFSTMNAYFFAKNGAESHLFMQTNPNKQISEFSKYFDLPELSNFHIHTFDKKLLFIKTNEIFYSKVTNQIIRDNNYDVVITRDPGFLPYLSKIKNRTKAKVFYQSHNFYLDTKLKDDINPANEKKFNKLERKYLSILNGMLALNNPQKELYRKYVNIPVFAGQPGLKTIYKSQDNFDKKIIFYSGSFQLKKGLDDLIEAFAMIKSNAKLILAGGRDEKEISLIKNLINAKNINNEIEITGWMDYASLLKKLENATVGIIPLKNSFYNNYLTAPSKLFDYLSFGIPVIAADLPSIKDFAEPEKNCLYYEAGNIEELVKKIDEMLSNYDKYNQIRENNINLANEYLWEKRTKLMMDFFESV